MPMIQPQNKTNHASDIFFIPESRFVPVIAIRQMLVQWGVPAKAFHRAVPGLTRDALSQILHRRKQYEGGFSEPTPVTLHSQAVNLPAESFGLENLKLAFCGTGEISRWFLNCLRASNPNYKGFIFGIANPEPKSNTADTINFSGSRAKSAKPFNPTQPDGSNTFHLNLLAIKDEVSAREIIKAADILFYSLNLAQFLEAFNRDIQSLPLDRLPIFILPIKSFDSKADTALEYMKARLQQHGRSDLLKNIVFMSGYTSANGALIQDETHHLPVLNLVGSGEQALAKVASLFTDKNIDPNVDANLSMFHAVGDDCEVLKPEFSKGSTLYKVKTAHQIVACRVETYFKGVEVEAYGSAMKNPLMLFIGFARSEYLLKHLANADVDSLAKMLAAVDFLGDALKDAQALYGSEYFDGYGVSDPVRQDIALCQTVESDTLIHLYQAVVARFDNWVEHAAEERAARIRQVKTLLNGAFSVADQPFGSRNHMAGLFMGIQNWAVKQGYVPPFALYDPVQGTRVMESDTFPHLVKAPEGVRGIENLFERASFKGNEKFKASPLYQKFVACYEMIFHKTLAQRAVCVLGEAHNVPLPRASSSNALPKMDPELHHPLREQRAHSMVDLPRAFTPCHKKRCASISTPLPSPRLEKTRDDGYFSPKVGTP